MLEEVVASNEQKMVRTAWKQKVASEFQRRYPLLASHTELSDSLAELVRQCALVLCGRRLLTSLCGVQDCHISRMHLDTALYKFFGIRKHYFPLDFLVSCGRGWETGTTPLSVAVPPAGDRDGLRGNVCD